MCMIGLYTTMNEIIRQYQYYKADTSFCIEMRNTSNEAEAVRPLAYVF